jgi:spermidine synthase
VDPFRTGLDVRYSGIMSRVDLTDPLYLVAPYTQAMMLSLIWRSDPKRVYVVGFGGGRVPLVLHHYISDVIVESTDIDPDALYVASRYFGFKTDRRQRVILKDGRDYLANRPANIQYDIILLDAFRGIGYGPYHLFTREFFRLCKSHLVDGGVVAVNLVSSDELLFQKINTFRVSFQQTYLLVDEDALVIFGTDAPDLEESEIVARAEAIQKRHDFSFPFLQRAQELKPLSELPDYLAQLEETTEIFTDSSQLPEEIKELSPNNPIFYNVKPQDPCPCGSGRQYQDCHGVFQEGESMSE